MEEEKCLYQTVYSTLQEQIRTGKIQPGERLPAEKVLAEEFDVSRITVQKAMSMLVQDGYVIRRPGRGSFATMNVKTLEGEKGEDGNIHGESARIIGLVMEDFSASFGLELLKAIEEAADREGYSLCIKRSRGDQKREKRMLESLQEMGVKGILAMPTHGQHYNREILKMVGEGMSVVFLDRYLEGLPVPFVGTDNKKAMEGMIDYLLQKGCRKMALLTAKAVEAVSLEKRIEGFEERRSRSLAEGPSWEGYLLDTIRSTIPDLQSRQSMEADAEKIERFLAEHRDLDAVIAAEFDIAVLTESVCRKMGIRVPEEMRIVCFDGPVSTYGEYTYPHVRQDEEGIGNMAVQTLVRLIQGESIIERMYVESRVVSQDLEGLQTI